MASFKGLYDKLMSIIKTDTVVNSGAYTPVNTDIIPVYDYQNAVDSITGEKIATKKFVRATDLGGGGGGSSTETILYSNLTAYSYMTTGVKLSFTIPGGTVPSNSMLYLEAKAYSTSNTEYTGWKLQFSNGAFNLGQAGTSATTAYIGTIKLININNATGSFNTVTGAANSLNPNDYSTATSGTYVSRHSINWSLDQTIDLSLLGTLPPTGVTIQMFRIKLVTETPMP